jgi:hypothetical protein
LLRRSRPRRPEPRTCWRRSLAAGALLAALGVTSGAHADDRAAAQALFDAGKVLMGENKIAEACPKFEASYKLDKTLGTLLNMADCHEKAGKLATAWAEFGAANERASRAGDNRAEFAKQREDALTPRLPKLQITVQNPRPTLTIHRDDARLEEAAYGVALPIDPGKHPIVVKRGDEVIHQQTVETAEGATAAITVDLAAIERAAPPPRVTTNRGDAGALPPERSSQKLIGFIVGGVGLAAVAGAAVLEVVAISKKPGADQCVNQFCSPTGFQSAQDAETFANVGQWVGIGGLVAVAIGVTLVLTAPSEPDPAVRTGTASAMRRGRSRPVDRPRAWATPWAAPTGGGLAVGGRL